MVIETERYKTALRDLPAHVQRVVQMKVEFLRCNARHPSLRVHRCFRAPGLWEAYAGLNHRLLFRIEGDDVILVNVGKHKIVDLVWKETSRV